MAGNRIGWIGAFGLALMAAAPALAETAQMTGRFPAQYREAAMLRSLSVDRIGGRDGQALSMAIERALSGGYFDLVYDGRRGSGRADGALSGAVSSGVEDSYYKRPEKRCAEKDKDGKCTKEEEVQVNCTRRVANLNADLRIVRAEDGRIVYSSNKPNRQEITWCQGQSPSRTAEEMINSMIGEAANAVRAEITPHTETYRIRFRESTKGLPKDQNNRFKATVKLSQRDLRAACADWASMNQTSPNHPSVVFNLGLCAEAAGDLRGALAFYQQAIGLLGQRSEAGTGAGRVQSRMVADADAAERARRG
ncbi:MAG: hypothetical protein V4574_00385 [Pseudomonadota bacterium]